MGYSTKAELIQALANALSQGSPDTPGTLVDIFTVGKLVSDTVNDTQVYQYIKWADENIDAWFNSIYQTPFQRVNRGSYDVAVDITAGDTFLILADATRFTIGDVILLRDSSAALSQQLTISDIPNDNKLVFSTPITNSYTAANTKVERIRYPDPLPKMSARLAAATLYDKHFAAQVEGNESNYGKYLRKLVYDDAEKILNGAIRLIIPDAGLMVGRRFYNPALDDVYSTRAKPEGKFFGAE